MIQRYHDTYGETYDGCVEADAGEFVAVDDLLKTEVIDRLLLVEFPDGLASDQDRDEMRRAVRSVFGVEGK